MAAVKEVKGEVIGAEEDEEHTGLAKPDKDPEKAGVPKQKSKSLSRIFTECWMAMFIAEWGDRTQIAMIGQHASQPIIPVCVGSLVAFFLLTVSAVMVGMFLDGMRLSEKKVHLVSSISFFIFAALA